MASSNGNTKFKIEETSIVPTFYFDDKGHSLKSPPNNDDNSSENSHSPNGNSSENSHSNLNPNLCFRAMRECLKPIETSINTFLTSDRTMYKVGRTMLITTCILGLGIGLTAATFGIAPAAVAMATGAAIAWHAITGAAVVAGPAIAHAATTTGSAIAHAATTTGSGIKAHRVAAESGAGGLMLAGLGALGFLRHKKKADKADAELYASMNQLTYLGPSKNRLHSQ